MIKGVTKNIIEVAPRDHEYFEKAIIILKSSPDLPDTETLQNYASLFLGEEPSFLNKKKTNKFLSFIFILIGILLGMLICCFLLLFV